MTTYIVKDKDGREVWRDEADGEAAALVKASARSVVPSLSGLMRAAGYTVEEAVEMIEVPVNDLRLATGSSTDGWEALMRLRALVEKHRSGK